MPYAVKYDNTRVNPPTQIDSELLFYSHVKNNTAIIHLGLDQKNGTSYNITIKNITRVYF